MAIVFARVPATAIVKWNILAMVMRTESEELTPELHRLVDELKILGEEVSTMVHEMEKLRGNIDPLLRKVEALKQDTMPLWDDSYNLCGDPKCYADCRVCQEGEEDYEEDYGEKYCRRGRR